MRDLSIFIAYILRHNPSAAGVEADFQGWVDVDKLIKGVCATGRKIDRATLEKIVATDEKTRYSFNSDGTKIRANQGHSIPVDVGLEEKKPPEVLYHGTAEKNLESIKEYGILKKRRNFVHLSKDMATAEKVGTRHGKPVVLTIDTGAMYRDGYKFFISVNGVWQTDSVPVKYIRI